MSQLVGEGKLGLVPSITAERDARFYLTIVERTDSKNKWPIIMAGDEMKFLKYAALVALAVLPFMLVKKKKELVPNPGREVDSDEIFDFDLKAN